VTDRDRWARLAFHLYDMRHIDDPDTDRAARDAVLMFAAIHHRFNTF